MLWNFAKIFCRLFSSLFNIFLQIFRKYFWFGCRKLSKEKIWNNLSMHIIQCWVPTVQTVQTKKQSQILREGAILWEGKVPEIYYTGCCRWAWVTAACTRGSWCTSWCTPPASGTSRAEQTGTATSPSTGTTSRSVQCYCYSRILQVLQQYWD